MSICLFTHDDLRKKKLLLLASIIFTNFKELADYQQLKHSMEDIMKLLQSENAIVCLYIINKKTAGYMVGEIMKLNDGREVFYVSYIFTSPKFRNNGIASKLMNTVDELTNKYKLDGIMLTCNSEDKHIYDFYLKKGFMPDMLLRTYAKYEVMYK